MEKNKKENTKKKNNKQKTKQNFRRKRGGSNLLQLPQSLGVRKKPHTKPSYVTSYPPVDISKEKEDESYLFMVSKVYAKLNSRELEAARRTIRRAFKKSGKLFVISYPYLPLTKKPLQVRMGKGKSSKVRDWVCPVVPGQVIFSLKMFNATNYKRLFAFGSRKLSVPVHIFCKVPPSR